MALKEKLHNARFNFYLFPLFCKRVYVYVYVYV